MFLQLTDLTLSYPGAPQPSVRQVSLGLRPGEIGVLMGPSGCGKTTLLRALAGLETVTGGHITVAGETVSGPGVHVAPEHRRMGMVFQDYALFPHLDVARNVGFGLAHLAAPERAERVTEVLELVGLTHLHSRYPHGLSGGQQQRVALARALAPRPRLLLLDEPFSNLDVGLREQLAHDVRAILKASGTTALLVTHDQQEAYAVGDVMGVMHEGQLHQWDTGRALYHRPATRFVAGFVGKAVLLPGRAHGDGAQLMVETPLGSALADGTATGECDVLLRVDDLEHDEHSSCTGTIERMVFRGADSLCTVRLESGAAVIVRLPCDQPQDVGDRLGVRIRSDKLLTFARE